MAARVNIFQGVISDIGVAVEALRVFNIWYNGIGRYEAVKIRDVVPRIVIDKAEVVVVLLPDEQGIAH